MQGKLIRPEYIQRDAEKVHYLSAAGRRHYAELFRQYGQALPLPEASAAFNAAMWHILDQQLQAIVGELQAELPRMSAVEKAAGYWNPIIRQVLPPR
jgi:hypothetical protein